VEDAALEEGVVPKGLRELMAEHEIKLAAIGFTDSGTVERVAIKGCPPS